MRPAMVVALGLLVLPAARADVARRRSAVVEVVQKVGPAVVFIGTEQVVDRRMRGSPLEEFFFGDGGRQQRQTVQSLGSGVIIDSGGTIVTNDHVIRGASAVHVVLADGRQLDAEVVGADAQNDLALLRVASKTPLPAARLGTSSDLMIGETVVAIGSPFGLTKTVTSGVLSAVGRSFKANDQLYIDFLQTDAAINPGNSGGPLMNLDGEVIGINTAIFGGAQGIGFAIPVDKVRRIVQELKSFGKVRPAWVGINAVDLTAPIAQRLGWERSDGVVVDSVDTGSPAAAAGVQAGDVVAELGGSPVRDADEFQARVRGYPAKAVMPLVLWREGRMLTLTVTPAEFPSQQADAFAWDRLGLRLQAARGTLAVSAVRAQSQAAAFGIERGDLIVRLNNVPLDSLETFREALISARHARSVLLVVRRAGRNYLVTFRL
ncbi:MAG TPA: trypsin-like peptidase domain-containing protein [Myxococcaceae bacterium]|nr:trypsin-like peptidase domain-containing protein [Myxococcaceae bacterium]